jgi:hypothetical protein
MKRFALLVLRNGGNRVIDEIDALDVEHAAAYFNQHVEITRLNGKTVKLTLDKDGYFKDVEDEITYTIAQYLY